MQPDSPAQTPQTTPSEAGNNPSQTAQGSPAPIVGTTSPQGAVKKSRFAMRLEWWKNFEKRRFGPSLIVIFISSFTYSWIRLGSILWGLAIWAVIIVGFFLWLLIAPNKYFLQYAARQDANDWFLKHKGENAPVRNGAVMEEGQPVVLKPVQVAQHRDLWFILIIPLAILIGIVVLGLIVGPQK